MLYALIDAADAVVRVADFAEPPVAPNPAKGGRWLPVLDHRPEPGPQEALDGPDTVVGADAVRRTWTARSKTVEERLTEVRAARAAAYPAIGDQLDALFKARNGDDADLRGIDDRIAAVKAAHPKPAA